MTTVRIEIRIDFDDEEDAFDSNEDAFESVIEDAGYREEGLPGHRHSEAEPDASPLDPNEARKYARLFERMNP